jgi:hypothetical protein
VEGVPFGVVASGSASSQIWANIHPMAGLPAKLPPRFTGMSWSILQHGSHRHLETAAAAARTDERTPAPNNSRIQTVFQGSDSRHTLSSTAFMALTMAVHLHYSARLM